ncbi:MAG: DUF5684 domain-containing protein [bacterium]|nr:DUF5684 domain-containing protein [bacterium]
MFKYLLASSLIAAPQLSAAVGMCMVNGQSVACPDFANLFGGFFAGMFVVWLVVIVLSIVALWKIFTKAGKPGWASIIPIYNMVVLMEIIRKPLWWVFLMFIPFVNIAIAIIAAHRLSKSFGKDVGFTIGLLLLGPIFYVILAFGKSVYSPIMDQEVVVPPMPPTPEPSIPQSTSTPASL